MLHNFITSLLLNKWTRCSICNEQFAKRIKVVELQGKWSVLLLCTECIKSCCYTNGIIKHRHFQSTSTLMVEVNRISAQHNIYPSAAYLFILDVTSSISIDITLFELTDQGNGRLDLLTISAYVFIKKTASLAKEELGSDWKNQLKAWNINEPLDVGMIIEHQKKSIIRRLTAHWLELHDFQDNRLDF